MSRRYMVLMSARIGTRGGERGGRVTDEVIAARCYEIGVIRAVTAAGRSRVLVEERGGGYRAPVTSSVPAYLPRYVQRRRAGPTGHETVTLHYYHYY